MIRSRATPAPTIAATLFAAMTAFVVIVTVAAPAGAQPARSADGLAKRYGLLRESDLPTGYEFDFVQQDPKSPAYVVEVTGDCERIDAQVGFPGARPTIAYSAFSEPVPSGSLGGNGLQTVYSFPRVAQAKKYYARWAAGFREIAACGLMTTPSGVTGTYASIDLGKAGNQRAGLSFDSDTDDEFARLAVARGGKKVVYLALSEDDAADADFGALVKRALSRAG